MKFMTLFLTSCNVSLPVTVISFNMKYLMTDPERDIEFCFQKISTFSGNKIYGSPRDQSLSDLLYIKVPMN